MTACNCDAMKQTDHTLSDDDKNLVTWLKETCPFSGSSSSHPFHPKEQEVPYYVLKVQHV